MSDKKNNGGNTADSQGPSAQDLINLIEAFKTIPVSQLAEMPEVVASVVAQMKSLESNHSAIEAERKALAEERAQFEADRKEVDALKKESASEMALVAKQRSELTESYASLVKQAVDAAATASELHGSTHDAISLYGKSLDRMESKVKTMGVSIDKVGQAVKAGADLSVIQFKDTLKTSQEIKGSLASLHGKSDMTRYLIETGFSSVGSDVGTLQSSVDKIGEMMNRMMDFITHIRDEVVATRDVTMKIETGVANSKAETFKIVKVFHEEVMKGFEKFSHIPKQVEEKVTLLNTAIVKVRGESKALIERSRKFSDDMEARLDGVMDTIGSLRDLYTHHVKRLDQSFEIQMELVNTRMHEGIEDIVAGLSEAMKQSDIHKFLGQVHSQIEELKYAQQGVADLLNAVRDEEMNFAAEVKATTTAAHEALSMNAKQLTQSLDGTSKDVSETRRMVTDAVSKLTTLNADIERTRHGLSLVTGQAESLLNLSLNASRTVSQEYMESTGKGILAASEDLKSFLRNELTGMKSEMVLGFLKGDSTDEEGI